MDLDELQSVRDAERNTDSLQELPDSFYTDVADHIADLKERRDRVAEQADDPFADPEVQQLTGEIDTTEQVVEAIYERRVGKLVKLASFAAADMPADEEGLTTEERRLFSDLVARIKDNRTHVLDVLAGEDPSEGTDSDPDSVERGAATHQDEATGTPVSDPASTSESPSTSPTESADADADESRISAAELMGGGTDPVSEDASTKPDDGDGNGRSIPDSDYEPETGSEPPVEPESESPPESEPDSTPNPEDGRDDGIERTTLRITRDIGEIVGVDDREYELASEDVVSLPEANAGALVSRDAAERLE